MERKIRVIQYGLGTTGLEIVTLMLEKEGIEIVGAIAKTKNIGKDLGDVLGLKKRLGVTVSSDPEAVFSSVKADLVVHATVSYLPDAWTQVMKPIEAGLNVITIAGGLVFPPPDLAKEMDEKAKRFGVTVFGTGVNPGFALDLLPLFLSGISRKVNKITVRRIVDFSKIRPEFLRKVGIGMTMKEFQKASAEGSILALESWANPGSLNAIADSLGWKLDETKVTVEPILAERIIDAPNIKVEPGILWAFNVKRQGMRNGKEMVSVEVECGVGLEFEAKNEISIEGDPNITETMIVEGASGTAPLVVNNIPHVLNAQPGFFTPLDLPVTPCLLRDVRELVTC